MNSIEIEAWLEAKTGKEVYTPGLERVKNAIESLNLRPKSKIITIAGTNGKGSVTRLLHSTLEQNFSVASFTSPHLYKINERFKINDKFVSDQCLEKSLKALASKNLNLTYYEYLFVAFLDLLKDTWPQFIILEVGLGGRLDATNALDSTIAVITSISRDHQEYLGNRFDLILKEKIAISRKNLITGFSNNYLERIAERYCLDRGIQYNNIGSSKNFKDSNHKLVLEVLKRLDLELNLVKIKDFKEIELKDKKIHFFGSHNPDAVRKLVQFLRQEHYNNSTLSYDLLVLSFSHRDQKDLETMLRTFKLMQPVIVKDIVVTSFVHFKAERPEVLQKICELNGIRFVEDIKTELKNTKTILCSGSNYFYRSFYDSVSL